MHLGLKRHPVSARTSPRSRPADNSTKDKPLSDRENKLTLTPRATPTLKKMKKTQLTELDTNVLNLLSTSHKDKKQPATNSFCEWSAKEDTSRASQESGSMSPVLLFKKFLNTYPIEEVDETSYIVSERVHLKFEEIFWVLDGKKVGYLDKTNCNICSLPEEIKYLLGGVISKVRYQTVRLTREEFVQEGTLASTTMNSSQVNRLLQWNPPQSRKPTPHQQPTPRKGQPHNAPRLNLRSENISLANSKEPTRCTQRPSPSQSPFSTLKPWH